MGIHLDPGWHGRRTNGHNRASTPAETTMKYGVSIIPNTGIMAITELAVAVEERGLDALFMGEHIHIPVKPRIAYPLPTMSAEYGRGGRRNPAHQAGQRRLPGYRA